MISVLYSRCFGLCVLIGFTSLYAKVDPGFSLLNKSDAPIFIIVDNGGTLDLDTLSRAERGKLMIAADPFIKTTAKEALRSALGKKELSQEEKFRKGLDSEYERKGYLKTLEDKSAKLEQATYEKRIAMEKKRLEELEELEQDIDTEELDSTGSKKNRHALSKKQSLFINRTINLEQPTTIYIFDRNSNLLYKAEFPKGKTIYVHWDGTRLYSQTGPFKGLKGETDMGYSLKNNVKDNEIKEL